MDNLSVIMSENHVRQTEPVEPLHGYDKNVSIEQKASSRAQGFGCILTMAYCFNLSLNVIYVVGALLITINVVNVRIIL
jgi:hypothetical protein